MTDPLTSAYRFAIACLLGCGLGLWYGFLRPLRLRHPHISDLLFLPGAVYAWLLLGFQICRGDLRPGPSP